MNLAFARLVWQFHFIRARYWEDRALNNN
uniref:Uncharacterized protein n=1 Tax=Arundo donax TaxID=35708 RepID=A0A0A8YG56_ARUDO